MASKKEVRKQRLQSDYKEMCRLSCDAIKWAATSGEPPHVDSYRLTLKVRTIIDPKPKYRTEHIVDLTIPAGYPFNATPLASMKTSPPPFHPNWYKDARWCPGYPMMSESLGQFVVRLFKTLQFDREITNPDSAANQDAKNWYLKNFSSEMFPCDTTQLKDPTGSRFKVKSNPSKFVIKHSSSDESVE